MKPLKAFLYWYMVTEYSKPNYIWIFAVSKKQALFFFRREGLHTMADYCVEPCEIKTVFRRQHKIGDILGDKTIL